MFSSSTPARYARKRGFRASAAAFTLIEIMIVVLIIGILLAIAVPNFVKARESARTKSCIANLQQIQSAKQQFAMDNKLAGTVTVAGTDIFGTGKYVSGPVTGPVCPAGTAVYDPGVVDTDVVCPNLATNATHVLNGP